MRYLADTRPRHAGGGPSAVLISSVLLLVALLAGAGSTYWLLSVNRGSVVEGGPVVMAPLSPAKTPGPIETSESSKPARTEESPTARVPTVPLPTASASPPATDFAALFTEVSSGVVMLRATSCDGEGSGSGFLVSNNEVLTAAHVIDGAASIAVIHNGLPRTADVVGVDSQGDVALLQLREPIEGAHIFHVSDEIPPAGTAVAVIGHPLGDPMTITGGNVSRADDALWPDIQLDVSVSPGNSGGPVMTSDGDVVGILTAKDAHAEGLAYATGSDLLTLVMEESWPLAPAASARCDRPLGPDHTEVPTIPVTGPLAHAIAETFAHYFGGINSGQYRRAYRQLSPRLQNGAPFESFAHGVSTSFDFDFEVGAVTLTDRGAEVWLMFVSLQSPSMGPGGESCTQWSLDYQLVWGSSGRLLIDSAKPHDGDGHVPCQ